MPFVRSTRYPPILDLVVRLRPAPAPGDTGEGSTSGATTSLTITAPTHGDGDLLVATLSTGGTSGMTITPPAGWTEIASQHDASQGWLASYYKFASGEGANWTWNFDESVQASGSVTAFSGVDTTNPVLFTGTANTGSDASPIGLSVQIPRKNSLLLLMVGAAGTETFTPPTGMTELAEVASSGGSDVSSYAAYQRIQAVGDSGNKTATLGGSQAWQTQMVVIANNENTKNLRTVRLDWTDNADNEDAYYVERSLDGGSTWAQIASLAANAITYDDAGLSKKQTYYYRVRAGLTTSYSDYSNVANVST